MQVRVFYTAPTLIRALMQHGDEPVKRHDRSSLRVLGTVGEPIGALGCLLNSLSCNNDMLHEHQTYAASTYVNQTYAALT